MEPWDVVAKQVAASGAAQRVRRERGRGSAGRCSTPGLVGALRGVQWEAKPPCRFRSSSNSSSVLCGLALCGSFLRFPGTFTRQGSPMTRGNHVALSPEALEKLSEILVVINAVSLGRALLLQSPVAWM